MEIRKIKSIRPNFDEQSGPSDVVTLGITNGECDVIFGRFYFGPHMDDSHGEECRRQEEMIDYIVARV